MQLSFVFQAKPGGFYQSCANALPPAGGLPGGGRRCVSAQAGHAGGFQVACLGDAAAAQAGEYNLASFSQLLQVAQAEA